MASLGEDRYGNVKGRKKRSVFFGRNERIVGKKYGLDRDVKLS